MTAKRKVCVVTGSRAEYGLLYWLMKEIAEDTELELQVDVTGMHLSPDFGLTYRLIEADGFRIDERVEMLLPSDTPVGIAKSIGRGVAGMADAFAPLSPDIAVVLGDRFEILAVAEAAMVARVPIAHLHGGETTQGSYDEAIRHSITKMSQWHFVAAEPYRKRVVQLGEQPERVYNFGAPGLDYLQRLEPLGRSELEESLGIALKAPVFVVTYHPATLGSKDPAAAMTELFAALDEFPESTTIITSPNADTGSRALIALIDRWVAAHSVRAKAFTSLGQRRYLSLLQEADAIVGNTSSGLTEAVALKKATVNIGERQTGRLKATSVIDAAETKPDIVAAIRKALSADFQRALPGTQSLYGSGDASRRIKDVLKAAKIETQKAFFDIDHAH